MPFKKWKSRTYSILSFLNDENHTQFVSPGKKKLIWLHVIRHEWMEAAFVYLYFWTNTFVNKNHIVAANFVFAGIKSHICVCFCYVILNKSQNLIKVMQCQSCIGNFCNLIHLQILVLVLASHTSMPRLILLLRQVLTHIDLFLFF